MKKNILLLVLFSIVWVAPSCFAQDIFDDFDSFFKLYVKMGRVDYIRVSQNMEPIKELVNRVGKYKMDGKSEDEKIAFCINAYNLLTIYQIAEYYPRIGKTIDIDGFFKKRNFTIAGRQMTLDDIEFKDIFTNRKDPRIHFALVCGAVSCPLLDTKGFRAETLNDQLERRTKIALNLDVERKGITIEISKIFEWYKEDFGSNKSIVAFLNKYLDEKLPSNSTIVYREYDWRLNDIAMN